MTELKANPQGMVIEETKCKLFAPKEYWRLRREEPETLAMLVGGCGPGGFGDRLVPDRIPPIIGTKITQSCAIHDFYYSEMMPGTIECKEQADRVFFNNMLRQVDNDKWFKRIKKGFAYLYYKMVKLGGAPAFWGNKELGDEFREV